jgi:hypothetical protein
VSNSFTLRSVCCCVSAIILIIVSNCVFNEVTSNAPDGTKSAVRSTAHKHYHLH